MKHRKNPNFYKPDKMVDNNFNSVKRLMLWRLSYMVKGNDHVEPRQRDVEIQATEQEIDEKVADYISKNPRRKLIEVVKLGFASLWWLLLNIPVSVFFIAFLIFKFAV